MKFQVSSFLLAAACTEAFAPLSTNSRTSVAVRAGVGLAVDLPSIESQVSNRQREQTLWLWCDSYYWTVVERMNYAFPHDFCTHRCFVYTVRNAMFYYCSHQIAYQPGKADTDFARRFGGPEYVNADIRTVGEAFAVFTEEYGFSINALYKNMVNDIVGTVHLITVNARFVRDPVWSLGILTTLELLLKNYPEPGMYERITSSLFKSCNLDEAAIRAEAASLTEWAQGKTKEDVEAALKNADESILGVAAKGIKEDEFWMYSKFFGIGLVKVMELTGVEMDKDEVYPIMENWMSTQLGRSHLTACVSPNDFLRLSLVVENHYETF